MFKIVSLIILLIISIIVDAQIIEHTAKERSSKQYELDEKLNTYFDGIYLSFVDNCDNIIALLEQGANPNIIGGRVHSPLFKVASVDYGYSFGHYLPNAMRVAQALLQHSADVNFQAPDFGHSILNNSVGFVTAQHGSLVTLLLDYGADPRLTTIDKRTALHVCYKHPQLIKLILTNSHYSPTRSESKLLESRKRIIAFFWAVKKLKTQYHCHIPPTVTDQILSYLPEDWYSQKVANKLLKYTGGVEQCAEIATECPYVFLKNAMRSNKEKFTELRDALVIHRIQEGRKLLTQTDDENCTPYQKIQADIIAGKNYFESLSFLDPDTFEENFAQPIHDRVMRDMNSP